MMENVFPSRESVVVDGERTSPWEKTHGEPFNGQLIPLGAKVIIKPSETKGDFTSRWNLHRLLVCSMVTNWPPDAAGVVSIWFGLSKKLPTWICRQKVAC